MRSPRSAPARLRPTTLRRTAWAALGWAGPALAGSPAPEISEAVLVQEALAHPAVQARLAAISAGSAAEGTPPPLFANPTLEGRREQARGPAGATTEALTGSWSVDLGFAGVPAARAAALTRASGEELRWIAVSEVVCATRHAALDLWAAEARRAAVDDAHDRLEQLVSRLEALAQAGEVAGYDVSRLQVADAVHRAERDQAVVAADDARTELARLLGRPVAAVALLPVTPHPALDRPAAELTGADPLSRALRREVEAAAARLASARRAALPDLLLFGGARWDAPPGTLDRSPGWEAGAALELPAFARNQPAVASAEAELAEARARAAEREALLGAQVGAASRRLAALGELHVLPAADLWTGGVARYVAGEASIDELLVVASDVEAARSAYILGERLRREAHLDLACALGAFPEPELRSVLGVPVLGEVPP